MSGTETCNLCDEPVNLCWHAPTELWRQFNESGHDAGVLCARCFDWRARYAGTVLYWEASLAPSWPSCAGTPCPHEETMRVCCAQRNTYWERMVVALGEVEARRIVA